MSEVRPLPPPLPTTPLVTAFLAHRSPNTLAAYTRDLQAFARHLGVFTLDAAAEHLIQGGQVSANLGVLAYRRSLEARGLSSATVRRRLAALGSLVKVARLLGLIPWRLDVDLPRARAVRDTRGCGIQGYAALVRVAAVQRGPVKARRDVAMLRLMGDCGLRRAEVTALDVADVDFIAERIAVTGKGRGGEKVWVTLPLPTLAAVRTWLDARASRGLPASGPLFLNLDRKDGTRRLTASGLYRVLRYLGAQAGVKAARPNALRHAAITAVLDLTNGNVRAAQQFARHRNADYTLRYYDDNRRDLAGAAARLVAARVQS
jgi:integrase/recombinase XerC